VKSNQTLVVKRHGSNCVTNCNTPYHTSPHFLLQGCVQKNLPNKKLEKQGSGKQEEENKLFGQQQPNNNTQTNTNNIISHP